MYKLKQCRSKKNKYVSDERKSRNVTNTQRGRRGGKQQQPANVYSLTLEQQQQQQQ